MLVSRETGKRLAEARAEIELSAAFFDWFATAATAHPANSWDLVPGIHHEVTPRPLGVVAVITPWNFPVSIPARKIAAALAAGCTVVFKPSEVAPLSALRLSELVVAHVPNGVLSSVVGDPVVVTDTWLRDSRVRGLSFTGSTRTGQLLAAKAAPDMTRCVLELGGNAPFVVLDDADLARAVELLAIAKYRNNGQSCIAANHAWVPRPLLNEFTARFAEASERLVLGDPLDATTTLGPLTLPEDPTRVAELVEDAEAHGATVIRSQVRLPDAGSFAAPALCVDPGPSSRILTEEVFGPALAIRGYDDLDEVTAATRACAHGLAGYVVGRDTRNATAVARRLDVGIAGVNTATPNSPQVPFGGLKLSGLGWEGGMAGLRAFQAPQTIAVSGQ